MENQEINYYRKDDQMGIGTRSRLLLLFYDKEEDLIVYICIIRRGGGGHWIMK